MGRSSEMPCFDVNERVLIDPGVVSRQVRTAYPGPGRVGAVFVLEGAGEHKNFFTTDVGVRDKALSGGPPDQGGGDTAMRMQW